MEKENYIEDSGCLIICPYCKHNFNCFSNAESFSMIRCPNCKRWFHIHVKMGEKPTEYLSQDDFEKEMVAVGDDDDEFEEGDEGGVDTGEFPEPMGGMKKEKK
ncbi:hypothetical protein COT47_07000 [Candidatus Woesearchaeota archaeon CG08_land_8_20_14_0_20_43_7]|nr:MAG: hypothetical protein COT47_07000 [Candidatus Woesearchaeota archaeon CG08_land_8_20_14_0_20_43_7]